MVSSCFFSVVVVVVVSFLIKRVWLSPGLPVTYEQASGEDRNKFGGEPSGRGRN